MRINNLYLIIFLDTSFLIPSLFSYLAIPIFLSNFRQGKDQLPKVTEIVVFFVDGNNVLESIDANLKNF